MRSRTMGLMAALTAASLLFAGCTDTPKSAVSTLQRQEEGTGGSGPASAKGHKGHSSMSPDAGMMDAGTSENLGTTGQGVTGGSTSEAHPSATSPSGGVPAK